MMKVGMVVNEDNNVFWGAGTLKVLSEQSDVRLVLMTSERAVRAIEEEAGFSRKDLETLASKIIYLDRGDVVDEELDAIVYLPASSEAIAEIISRKGPLSEIVWTLLSGEKRVILVLSEKDFSGEHLEHLMTLADAGAYVLPKLPDIMKKGLMLDELLQVVTGSILEMLGLECDIPTFERDGFVR